MNYLATIGKGQGRVDTEIGLNSVPFRIEYRQGIDFANRDSQEVRGFDARELQGRDELMQAVMGAMQHVRGLKVEFLDNCTRLQPRNGNR